MIAHFEAPHSVTFVKELPKTATGKIQKIQSLRKEFVAPRSGRTANELPGVSARQLILFSLDSMG